MRKLLTIGITALAALTLTACGSNSSSEENDTAKKSSSVKTTKAKKADTGNSNKVTNGPLEKVDQWKYFSEYDSDGTLVKLKEVNQTVTQGDLTLTIESVKVYSMKAKSDDAKRMVADHFETHGVDTPYYILQVNWSAKNAGATELQTNGIESIVTNFGQQLELGTNLDDTGSGATLQPNGHREFKADGLLSDDNYDDLNNLKIKIGATNNTDSYDEISPETSIEIGL